MFPVRAFVPVRAWITSWATPAGQSGPAAGVPTKVSGAELRLGAVPQMVPPVTVKPPVPSEMLSAAGLSSVRVPPLVKELLPSKASDPVLDRVIVPSLVTVGRVPLAPIVSAPSTVNEPLEVVMPPRPCWTSWHDVAVAGGDVEGAAVGEGRAAAHDQRPPASWNAPLLVTDAAVETVALPMMV